MLGSIHELPTEVRNSFSPEDQEKFLAEYNKYDPKTEDETREALRKTWHACKELPSAFTFKAIAGADVVDKDKEIITVESIKKDMDKFLRENNGLMYEHGDYRCGTLWAWEPCMIEKNIPAVAVYGAIYGNNDVVREVRKKFKKGLNSLSIAGEAELGKYSCQDGVCATRRPVKTIMEVSLCTVPANSACRLISSHEGSDEGFAKSGSFINLPIRSIEVYGNAESTCPICQLAKSLRDIGYDDAHETHAGVHIRMDNDEFAKAYPFMKSNGLHVVRVGDDTYLTDKSYLIEKSYKDGLEMGYIEPNGTLNGNITKMEFNCLVERDVLENKNGIFKIRRPTHE